MILAGRLRPNSYVDSVALMRAAERLRRLRGVDEVALVMGTEANRAALAEAGLWPPNLPEPTAHDLVIVIRADGSETAEIALSRVEELLEPRERMAAVDDELRPRSVLTAARRQPGANLAVISVPGPYAAVEAHQALSAGLHVFLFSDDVPLQDEAALKRRARARGLLVMGPECGTSIVNGIGLGFANRVRRGPVGLVGASGTGLQEVTCLIHRLGSGVSQAIGTGGRDLCEEVGALTTLQALEWLEHDPDTRAIVLVSKPASHQVADMVLAAAAASGKPVVACLLGWQGPTPAGVWLAATLEEAALAAVDLTTGTVAKLESPAAPRAARATEGLVCGLFAGGTLCEEARTIVGPAGQRFVDFGDAAYTRGWPHPIIDPRLRNAAIAAAGDDPATGVLLLDVILGLCAHPDPAGAVGEVLDEARAQAARRGRALDVVAHVVGTDEDPQGLAAQEQSLCARGVVVCPTNRLAARVARELAGSAAERR